MVDLLVCLDPGHGGSDQGAIGPVGTKEAERNLYIAEKVRRYLEGRNVGVEMTRSDDIAVSLEARVKMTNQWEPDAFVSIHCNGSSDPSANGFEVWYPNQINNSCRVFEAGATLSNILDRFLLWTLRRVDRGCRFMSDERQEFYVLRNTLMPAALVECGFISNPEEERLLNEEFYIQKLALGLSTGILHFLQIPK